MYALKDKPFRCGSEKLNAEARRKAEVRGGDSV